jgi:hypothetical protein
MAPWVQRVFIDILPKLLCMQRPKKEDDSPDSEEQPPEVLTDVFHVPPDVEKYSPFCTNKYSTDFDIPGELSVRNKISTMKISNSIDRKDYTFVCVEI